MVEDPGQASALLPKHKPQPLDGPFWHQQPMKGSQSSKSNKLHSKVHVIQLLA